jgi:iron complex outermembrane receptor protein
MKVVDQSVATEATTGLFRGASLRVLNWVLIAAAAAAAAQAQAQSATDAQAQASAPANVEEVVVTGFRKSQVDAIKVKRTNEDIVEVISAEDIGKLPDESIADSIARLPGVASQRNNSGRWQDISINGLPPAMSTTLLNGFMQATTDNNRTTQFDQYPAEIINSVVVYKTGDAALAGAAIATVDLRTIRPLDYGKTTLAVGAQGEYDTRGALQPGADAAGYRANVTYITQFDDDKIGVMFGYSHILAPNQIYAQHPYGFNEPDDVVTGLQDQVRSDNLTRDSFVATIQYKPNDHLEIIVDGFDSTYDDNAIIRGVEIQTACCGNATAIGTPSPGVSSWDVAPQLQNYDYDEHSHLRSLDFTAKYDFGGGWKLKGDYGYSEAIRNSDRIELYSGFGLNGAQNTSTATLTAGAGAGGMIGISNWSENLQNVALGENLGWSNYIPPAWPGACLGGTVSADGFSCVGGVDPSTVGGAGFYERIHSNDTIQQTNWALSRDISGPISRLEAGVSYSVRKKDYIDYQAINYLKSGNESQAIPSSWLLAPTNLSAFGLPPLFSIDPVAAFNSGAYGQVEDERDVDQDWWISEHVWTPYVEAKINTAVLGHDLTGNVGVQFVHTSQTVTNITQQGNWPFYTFTPSTTTTKYWDILPSLNLTWHLEGGQDIRLGVGRSMARPRFDSMGGGSNTSYNAANANCVSGCASPWSGTIANPSLKPWVSDDVDLTYERYFAPGEGIAVEGFYKNLETFIYQKTVAFNFQSDYNAAPFLPAPATFIGPVSQYENASGGSVYGLVLSGNVYLKHISHYLDGFGLSATGTYIESNVHIPDPNTSPSGQIPELSKYITNVSFYWEKYGFSLRINDRFRSSYVQEVPNFNGQLQAIVGASENTLDFQAGYTVRSGRLKNLSMTFSAENLTDTPMNSYTGAQGIPKPSPKYPEYYKLFGTNLLFGVSYKY